jgi:hypothetical protein
MLKEVKVTGVRRFGNDTHYCNGFYLLHYSESVSIIKNGKFYVKLMLKSPMFLVSVLICQ